MRNALIRTAWNALEGCVLEQRRLRQSAGNEQRASICNAFHTWTRVLQEAQRRKSAYFQTSIAEYQKIRRFVRQPSRQVPGPLDRSFVLVLLWPTYWQIRITWFDSNWIAPYIQATGYLKTAYNTIGCCLRLLPWYTTLTLNLTVWNLKYARAYRLYVAFADIHLKTDRMLLHVIQNLSTSFECDTRQLNMQLASWDQR